MRGNRAPLRIVESCAGRVLTAKCLISARRERVILANQLLRLPNGQPSYGLVPPEDLDVGECCDYLFVAEPVANAGMPLLKLGLLGSSKIFPPWLTMRYRRPSA